MMSSLKEYENNYNICFSDFLEFPNYFVETGSFFGDSISWALDNQFKKIYSVDIDRNCYNICKDRFANDLAVSLFCDTSVNFLKNLKVSEDVLFWLDAHIHSHDSKLVGNSENYKFPILEELSLLKNYKSSIMVLDDIKPKSLEIYGISKDEIIAKLYEINPNYTILFGINSFLWIAVPEEKLKGNINEYKKIFTIDRKPSR